MILHSIYHELAPVWEEHSRQILCMNIIFFELPSGVEAFASRHRGETKP